MNYYGAKEIARSFRTVRGNTLTIAEEIPAEKYSFQAAPETRTVEKLLTHIALSYTLHYRLHAVDRATTLVGFDFFTLVGEMMAEEAKPRTKNEVIALLKANGEKWAGFLDGLSDSFLSEQVAMPEGTTPAAKSRFEMIISVKEHEMHHRAQLMLIERMLGITPHLTREMMARFAAAGATK